MGKWMNDSAKRAGLNTTDKKITNHSSRATAVSTLAKSGVGEQQIIKITGHSNANSIKPYLQLDKEHHEQILKKMRQDPTSTVEMNSATSTSYNAPKTNNNVYNNCTFNCTNLYLN
uniref:Tyr recombinase domain-containing protein n=1 Tax=Photinus pyralis TaxID=7054 RepID=A0A1Y1L3S3_PHOPY